MSSSSPPPSSSSSYANSSSYSRGETGEDDGIAAGVDGDHASDGRRIGKRRKKKKRGKTALNANGATMTDQSPAEPSDDDDAHVSGSGNEDDDWEYGDGHAAISMTTTSDPSAGGRGAGLGNNILDDANMGEEEDISIFGQTAGAINATWVECDRCKKVSGDLFLGVCPDANFVNCLGVWDHPTILLLTYRTNPSFHFAPQFVVETPPRGCRCPQAPTPMVLLHEQDGSRPRTLLGARGGVRVVHHPRERDGPAR